MVEETLNIGELHDSTIHVRDIASLRLGQDATRATASILPRGEVILIALGHWKAIIKPTSLILLDIDKPAVRSWATNFSRSLRLSRAERYNQWWWRSNTREGDVPFELIILEEILHGLVETFLFRLRVFRLVIDRLVGNIENPLEAEIVLPRLVIIKDAMSSFEITLVETSKLLLDLLNNDEDMEELLLTAQLRKRFHNIPLNPDRHKIVELLIENYHRQIEATTQRVTHLRRLLQSKQELSDIALNVHRNRMLRMNNRLGIAGVGLAMCTTIAGYLGMNVPSGLEECDPSVFLGIVCVTQASGLLFCLLCFRHVADGTFRGDGTAHLKEIRALQLLFHDLQDLDGIVGAMQQSDRHLSAEVRPSPAAEGCFMYHVAGETVSKETFHHMFTRSGRFPITQQETNTIFDILDRSKDGFLDATDFASKTLDDDEW